MDALANPPAPDVGPPPTRLGWGAEASTSDLLDALAAQHGKRLVFHYDGRDVLPGYHVTEVKAGQFASLDCGANPEAWAETFIQLWDVPAQPNRAHLSVDTFLGIMRKASAAVPLIPAAKLTFEVSDSLRPMALYQAEGVEADGGTVCVVLRPRASSCKPRDRWLAQEAGSGGRPCCGPSSAEVACGA